MQELPVYKAIAEFKPSDAEGIPLEEGGLVEVLFAESPDRWLCQRVDGEKESGWVPPSYLTPKSRDKLDTRSTQEIFREDVIQIKNKQQEAIMKRR